MKISTFGFQTLFLDDVLVILVPLPQSISSPPRIMKKLSRFLALALLSIVVLPTAVFAETFGVENDGDTDYPGMVSYNSGATQNDQINRLVQDSDGNLYTAGNQGTNTLDWLVQKYDSNGTLDVDWGDSGSVVYDGGGPDTAADLVLDADGNIYVAGYQATNGYDASVRKYDSTGTLDTSWGSSGMVTYNSEGVNNDLAYAIAIDDSNNIYVVAQAGINGGDITVLKYDANGALDTSWGGMGSTTPYNSGGSQYDTGRKIVFDSSGNSYIFGSQGTNGNDLLVLKYDSDGVLDTSWGGGDGVVTYNSGGTQNDVANDGVIDSSGNLYVTGYQQTNGTDFLILKYDTNGDLDTSWGGGDGVVTYNSGGTQNDAGVGLVLDGGNFLYVVGYQQSNGYDWLIHKYTPTGVLDSDFGASGIVTYNSGASQNDWANHVLIDNDGFVVVSGFHSTNGRDVAIRRYTSWGELDISFGNTPIGTFPQDYVLGSLAELGEDAASIDSVSIYADDEIGTTTLAIYDDSLNLVWESDEIISTTTDDWLTVAIASGTPATLIDVEAGEYYLAFQIDNGTAVPTFERGDRYAGVALAQSYGPFPDPLEDHVENNMLWSIYATYTPVPEPEVEEEEEEEESSGGGSSSHRRSSSGSSNTTPNDAASPVAFVALGSVEELMVQLVALLRELLEQLLEQQ